MVNSRIDSALYKYNHHKCLLIITVIMKFHIFLREKKEEETFQFRQQIKS